MNIERDLPLVEDILGAYLDAIGRDFDGYRNHVYRVVNLCGTLGDHGAADREKIQIAGCFHDIGIWTAGTLDYLAPSVEAAAAYLAEHGKGAWTAEVGEMIAMHHGVRTRAGSPFPLVEVFRRADIADFSLGVVPAGIPRAAIRRLQSAFPNCGFHRMLLGLGIRWVLRHPRNPLPMFRW